MSQTEVELLQVLTELEEGVAMMGQGGAKPNLLPLFSRIDQLTAQLPKDADGQLLHYLHKKSYQKARLYLQGRDEENRAGTCG